jgi:hypothetical protein
MPLEKIHSVLFLKGLGGRIEEINTHAQTTSSIVFLKSVCFKNTENCGQAWWWWTSVIPATHYAVLCYSMCLFPFVY